ncbi:hypothetical protein FAUST_10783 [Fusarium austroamericanum]|uniref:Uncharacterized protein n=1 Tax=Fusarium austroamericanum TaxID=282268 RepID=A0AAN5Z073_FUSAU|nr:hypothetical protein FAUST_10783 [Fusarium austroamericanum]
MCPHLLRYRKRSVWILGFYLPILIVPWVLTCILMHGPIFLPSYINQRGEYSMTDMQKIQDWSTVISIPSRIAVTLGLPIVSALMAQAVVVYSQLLKKGQENKLNPPVIIQPPLQSLPVPHDPLTVITCNDNPVEITNRDKTCNGTGAESRVVGIDPEPNVMELIPRNLAVNLIRQKIKSFSMSDGQTNLWHEVTNYIPSAVEQQRAQTFGWIQKRRPYINYFASSLANDTATGILREHAMRINSSISCKAGNVPPTCLGPTPFFTIFNRTGFATSGIKAIECVEGNQSADMWLRLEVAQQSDGSRVDGQALRQDVTAFNLSCRASSTRGYFEMGNQWNNRVFEPLLNEWPTRDDIRTNFNDYGSFVGKYRHPDRRPVTDDTALKPDLHVTWNSTPNLFGELGVGTPGPLALVVLSLFGNRSFFHLTSERPQKDMNYTMRDICDSENSPFQRLVLDHLDYSKLCAGGLSMFREEYPPAGNHRGNAKYELLPIFVARILETFKDPEEAESLFEMGMFFANEPRKTVMAMVVISTLIAVQSICLVWLVWYIASTPTWTDRYDSFALAQLGAQLDGLRGGGVRSATKEDGEYLKSQSGMVGVLGVEEKKQTTLTDVRWKMMLRMKMLKKLLLLPKMMSHYQTLVLY